MDKVLHLAIICDGNRRWAKARGLLPWDGHKYAIEHFRELADWCRTNPRIGTLTLWAFSTENWKRNKEEVTKLMELFETFLKNEIPWILEHKTRFLHAGRKDRIPPSLAKLFSDTEEQTKDFTGFTLQLAIDHGGKDEVVRAVRKLPSAADATEESIRANLDHPEVPDMDLIIRTSGEQRTSNFFLWHAAYAEWMFPKKHFPELETMDLETAIAEYDQRQRRFGK